MFPPIDFTFFMTKLSTKYLIEILKRKQDQLIKSSTKQSKKIN